MKKTLITLLLLFAFIAVPTLSMAGGCCSRHGGIANCDEASGRYRCKDGSLSASCKCTAPKKPAPPPKPAPRPVVPAKPKPITQPPSSPAPSVTAPPVYTPVPPPSPVENRVVGIADGDTIQVIRGGKPEKIRLYGIDCPEMHQDFGHKARQFTSDMVFGKVVDIAAMPDKDKYERTIAWVSVNGKSLNKELVRAGLAWWYRFFAPYDSDLAELEKQARQAKAGLWSQPNPVPPWQWRHRDQGKR